MSDKVTPTTLENIIRTFSGLLCAGIKGQPEVLPPQPDMEQMVKLAKIHGLCAPLYIGAAACGISTKIPAMKDLFPYYCAQLRKSHLQTEQLKVLCAELDRIGVDYMPLKGAVLRQLYPTPELRSMGDADILIRPKQYARIRPVLLELGFEEGVESDHELIWHSPFLLLELHKRLIPSYHSDYAHYFGDGWHRAVPAGEGSRYVMSDEDQMVYLFAHFAKHYRDGGIGVRHLLDLWVYRQKKTAMDEAYIRKELGKLHLDVFYAHILEVLDAWFNGGTFHERVLFISKFIINSGNWGQAETHRLSEQARQKSKAGSVGGGEVLRLLQLAFPSYMVMKQKYPVLVKAPILLPVFWPIRWAAILLFRRDKVRAELRNASSVSAEQVKTYEQALAYVGLRFSGKEKNK